MSHKILPLLLGTAIAVPAQAQLITRPEPFAGRIVSAKGGEQAQLVPDPRLWNAVPRQNLKPGDTLRTNAIGTLAVVFADQTQVRLGRNTVLVVKAVENGSPSALSLQSGSLWARAPRARTRLSVETPSATAAVRGTDWALQVSGTETELQVFDGAIEFFNEQGTLSVAAGQAARARLGEAPTRVITVQSTEREQMQYYLPAAEIYSFLSPTVVPRKQSITDRARILAIPAANRTAEDWLTLAEAGVGTRPKTEQAEALQHLSGMTLTPTQHARVTLLRAWHAAEDQEFVRARELFDQAVPGLDPDRAVAARYGRYVAAVQADPSAAATLAPPAVEPERLSSWLGQAFVAAFAGDYVTARAAAEEASRRFPEDAAGPAALAAIALLLDDHALLERATDEGLRRDPQNPDILQMRGMLEANFRKRFDVARDYYRRALAVAPASSNVVNGYAQVQSQRSATRETERLYQQGIVEHPKDALLRINHAIELLDENLMAKAKQEIDTALALDPSLAIAHSINGRYLLQQGQSDQAFDEALAGSAGDPGGAQSLLIAALTYYRRGEYAVALQQVDAADRLDPAGPSAPLIRAAIALDRLDIDTAISASREAQRRSIALGGDFKNPSQSSETGSYISASFRTIGLDDWGRFYGDRLFEPFDATGYFDRAIAGTPDPFLIRQPTEPLDFEHGGATDIFSNLMQGLALDPLSVAASERELQLFHERFVEATAGIGLIASHNDIRGNANGGFQAKGFVPVPFALNLSASADWNRGPLGGEDDRRDININGYLTSELTPYDKVVLFGVFSDDHVDLPGEVSTPEDTGNNDGRAQQLFAVYSHEFGRKSMLSIGGNVGGSKVVTHRTGPLPFLGVPLDSDVEVRQKGRARNLSLTYAANLGIIDLNIGADFAGSRQTERTRVTLELFGETETVERFSSGQERYHLDTLIDISPNIQLQGQIASADTGEDRVFDYRLGGAVQVMPNHWLRAAWFRDTEMAGAFTLRPTRVAGLLPNAAPLPDGARSKTLAVRWDAEWGKRLFTAVDYQHQRMEALNFALPQVISPYPPIFIQDFNFGPASLVYLKPRLDRLSFSANVWLEGGFGIFANYAHSWSHLPGVQTVPDGDVPFVPQDTGRIGIEWTSMHRLTARASATYTGRRRVVEYSTISGVAPADYRLGDFISVDASLDWESPDRRFLVSAAVTNLLDADYHLLRSIPGFGRAVRLSATYRF